MCSRAITYIHLHLLSLASTLATVFPQLPQVCLSGQMLADVPIYYYHICSQRIHFAHWISRVYPFSYSRHHTINMWDNSPPSEVSNVHYWEGRSFDSSIIQLSHLTAAHGSSETNSHTRCVSNNDNYHHYRTRLFDPTNKKNCIRSI